MSDEEPRVGLIGRRSGPQSKALAERRTDQAHLPLSTAMAAGEFNVVDLWWAVWRRRWLVLGCGLLFAAIAAFMVSRRQLVYSAYATLRLDTPKNTIPALDVLSGGDEEIDTEIQMLSSTALASTVADALGFRLSVSEPSNVTRGAVFRDVRIRPAPDSVAVRAYRFERKDSAHMRLLDDSTDAQLGLVAAGDLVTVPGAVFRLSPAALQYPKIVWQVRSSDDAAAEVSANLQVSRPARNANFIQVQYTDPDPSEAQAVPNMLVAAYIQDRVNASQSGAHSTAGFLRAQVAKLTAQLRASEDSLRRFSEAENIVSLDNEASSGVNQTAALRSQRNSIEAERVALATLVDRVVKEEKAPRPSGTPSPFRSLVSFPTLLRNDAASELMHEITVTEEQRSGLLARRSPTDPEVRFLDDRIAVIEGQLQAVVTTYLSGLQNQVTALDASIAQSTSRLASMPRKVERFGALQRNVKDLGDVVTQLQARLKEAEVLEASQDPTVRTVDIARRPTTPLPPHLRLWTAASLMAGLLLGVLLALGREYMDQTVHSRDEAAVATGMPTVGLVPRITSRQKLLLGHPAQNGAGVKNGKRSRNNGRGNGARGATLQRLRTGPGAGMQLAMLSEAYGEIETNIALAYPSRDIKVLLVTSALPGDGKTTSATNLALALAKGGERVVLVDADMRLGTVAANLRVDRAPGLSEVLQGELPLESVIRSQQIGGGRELFFITSGRLPAQPGRLLKSQQMQDLLERLRSECDRIVFDSPPVNIVPDAIVLGRFVDGAIVVARAGATPFQALVTAAEACRNAGVPVIGTVLNDIDFSRDATYDRGYQWYGLGKRYYAAAGEQQSG